VPAAFCALWAAIPIAWRGLPEGGARGGAPVVASFLLAALSALAASAVVRAWFARRLSLGDEGRAIAALPFALTATVTAVEITVASALLAAFSARLRESALEWPMAYGPAISITALAFVFPLRQWAKAQSAMLAEALSIPDAEPHLRKRRSFGEFSLGWFAFIACATALPLSALIVDLFDYGSAAAFTIDVQILLTVGVTFGAAAVLSKAVRRTLFSRVAEIDAIPGDGAKAHSTGLVEECAEMGDAIQEIGRRYVRSCESQAKLIETRSQTREKKARIFASMSHDLRGPLNSIVGFSDLLLKGIDGQLSPFHEETVVRISREAERLLALIGDILDTAKMEAGRFELERTRVSCEEIVSGCAAGAGRFVEAKGIAVRTAVEPGMPSLFVDRERVISVMLGLSARAADAMKGGSFTFGVRRVSSLEEGRDYALFELLDDGGDVSSDWREHVLDVFASLEGVTIASEDGGLALALALVQRVLKLHGGELDVGSSGARAVFAVALPLDLDEGEG